MKYQDWIHVPHKNTWKNCAAPGSIAIIMRTLDRPLCVPRAIRSILSQKTANWQLVIVNEGGNAEALELVLSPFSDMLKNRSKIIHHPQPVGRGAAINAGIMATDSEFIAIHDDDDSWEPAFLEETVKFLNDKANHDCCGVITYTARVLEEVQTDQIVQIQKNDFNSTVHDAPRVDLHRLMMQNTWPPISFLLRRAAVEKTGYFNNDLPVLEDWEFNLRCAFADEIGVIPSFLANYHHRTNIQQSAYGNSIIGTSDLCLKYETLIRNQHVRKLLDAENSAEMASLLLASGKTQLQLLNLPAKIMELCMLQEKMTQAISLIPQAINTALARIQDEINKIQHA